MAWHAYRGRIPRFSDGSSAFEHELVADGGTTTPTSTCTLARLLNGLTDGERNSLRHDHELGRGVAAVTLGCMHRCPPVKLVRKRVLLPHHKRDGFLDAAKKEAEALKSLAHPNIVQLVDCYGEPLSTYQSFYTLLMSPVGDSDLDAYLGFWSESSEISPKVNHNLHERMPCLASALAYMHRNGIRHQDIKPANIIHRGDQILFTDFGSCGRFQLGETTSTESPAAATKRYSAPEVLSVWDESVPPQKHGRPADVFSLGCVFLEMSVVATGGKVNEYREAVWSQRQEGLLGILPYRGTYAGAIGTFGQLPFSEPSPWSLPDLESYIHESMLSFEAVGRDSAALVLASLGYLMDNRLRPHVGQDWCSDRSPASKPGYDPAISQPNQPEKGNTLRRRAMPVASPSSAGRIPHI